MPPPASLFVLVGAFLCAWGDLNSHVIRHWNLNPARLPIPPQAPNALHTKPLSDYGTQTGILGCRESQQNTEAIAPVAIARRCARRHRHPGVSVVAMDSVPIRLWLLPKSRICPPVASLRRILHLRLQKVRRIRRRGAAHRHVPCRTPTATRCRARSRHRT